MDLEPLRIGTIWLAAVFSGVAGVAAAGELRVAVVDREGAPLRGVVVVAEPVGDVPESAVAIRAIEPRAMRQRNLSFEPGILVVQTGTPVSFPNDDRVKHHVYSFSPAKSFQLSLYSGSEHPPETFDTPGLVTLGCNIHDSMIGFVFVTDSPWFGKTSEDGELRLHGLRAGPYRVTIWHPRIRDDESKLVAEIEVGEAGGGAAVGAFELGRKLQPPPSGNPTQTWSGY